MMNSQAQALSPVQVPNVLYSSRRRSRRRGPAPGQTRLPDWVWGGGLGLIVLLFIGGYFLVGAATGDGGGGGQCDSPLPPLNTSDISERGFAEVDDGLTEIIETLQSGDRTRFDLQFYSGEVHSFTHNVDEPLREQDEDTARSLCEEVLFVEEGVSLRTPNEELVLALLRIQELLRDAAETLGYARPA